MTAPRASTLLGGRVHYEQLPGGHRSGIEPVLLAASIPARPGDRVLEAGTGAGAALLCLAHRIPGLTGLGIERDPALTGLARRNAAMNGFTALQFLAADLAAAPPSGRFDHTFANPPWHLSAGTASPDTARDAAKRAVPGLLAEWAKQLAAPLRHRGTVTFILAAAHLPDCLAAFAGAGCGSPVVLPLWPKPDVPAKLVLVRAIKSGRGPCRLLPGVVLHAPDGTYTPTATALLRDAAVLSLS